MKTRILLIAMMLFGASMAYAESDDCGLQLTAGASHKFNKKFNMSADVEMRTRNNFRTFDRWAFDIDASYKIIKHLKASVGYSLLYDNNEEKINYDEYGDLRNWRPSYWGFSHRFNVSLTGSVSWNRFGFSLRERWQYTHRPEKTVDRYDFSDEVWEDKVMKVSNKHVLRSRLKIDYDIAKCKVDPYVSAEFFNSFRLQKTRLILGAEWKISKKQSVEAFYRFQFVNNDDDNESNTHIIGIGYNYNF